MSIEVEGAPPGVEESLEPEVGVRGGPLVWHLPRGRALPTIEGALRGSTDALTSLNVAVEDDELMYGVMAEVEAAVRTVVSLCMTTWSGSPARVVERMRAILEADGGQMSFDFDHGSDFFAAMGLCKEEEIPMNEKWFEDARVQYEPCEGCLKPVGPGWSGTTCSHLLCPGCQELQRVGKCPACARALGMRPVRQAWVA